MSLLYPIKLGLTTTPFSYQASVPINAGIRPFFGNYIFIFCVIRSFNGKKSLRVFSLVSFQDVCGDEVRSMQGWNICERTGDASEGIGVSLALFHVWLMRCATGDR